MIPHSGHFSIFTLPEDRNRNMKRSRITLTANDLRDSAILLKLITIRFVLSARPYDWLRPCLILLFLLSAPGTFSQDLDRLLRADSLTARSVLLPYRNQIGPLPAEAVLLRRFQLAENEGDERKMADIAALLSIQYYRARESAKAERWLRRADSLASRATYAWGEKFRFEVFQGLIKQQERNWEASVVSLKSAFSLVPGAEKKSQAMVASLLGLSYSRLNRDQETSEYFRRAARLFENEKMFRSSALSYVSLAEYYLKKDQPKQALEALTSAARNLKSPADNDIIALVYRDRGLVHYRKGEFEKALENFKISLGYEPQNAVQKLVKDTYMQLFTLSSYQNDFERADRWHEKYRTLKDSLDKTTARRTNTARETDLRQKEEIISLLQKENDMQAQQQLEMSRLISRADVELQQKDKKLEQQDEVLQKLTREKAIQELELESRRSELERQQAVRNMLLVIAASILIIALLLYNRYRWRSRTNEKLLEVNNELVLAMDKLKTTQDQLVHAEKLASLGKLTAGVAHEIQNPLNFVRNFSESSIELIDELKTVDSDHERNSILSELQISIAKVLEHESRADQIVKSMLAHARSESAPKVMTDVNRVLKESLALAWQSSIRHGELKLCEFTEDYAEGLPELSLSVPDISRVFINLFNNSFYSMAESKKERHELIVKTFETSDSVLILIQDNGTGIPPENRSKIMEPFFTTKPSGKGTGLGLSISYEIIKSHGGTLDFESERDVYTRFLIKLPVSHVSA